MPFLPLVRYIWQHIPTIIESYNGGIPLAHFLKNYFKLHPKLGSRDRKILSEMAYCWYRCNKALPDELSLEDKVKACLFVCETSVRQVLQFLPAEWQENASSGLHDRLEQLSRQNISFNIAALAAFEPVFSEGMAREAWLQSMLSQPRLFIRLREQKDKVQSLLKDAGIAYETVDASCLSLPNGAPVDKILPAAAYVVQDASSQGTGAYLHPHKGEHWWDSCSGAGGKSLLLKDKEPAVRLTVSDKRASILNNLKERFRMYGHELPRAVVADIADANAIKEHFAGQQFDNILCDVPCSGSGTWARTPEYLYFYDPALTKQYAQLQYRIARNTVPYLKPGGKLIYITCSVFREENEAVMEQLIAGQKLTLIEKQLINGIGLKADSMFIAVLRNS